MKQTIVMLSVLFATAVYGIHFSARAGDPEFGVTSSAGYEIDSDGLEVTSSENDDEDSSGAFELASQARGHVLPGQDQLALESALQEAQRFCAAQTDKDSPIASVKIALRVVKHSVSSSDNHKPVVKAVRFERKRGLAIYLPADPKVKWTAADRGLLDLRASRLFDNQSKLEAYIVETVEKETLTAACAQALLEYGIERAFQSERSKR